jgi:CBS domain-containing protein
MTVGEICKRPVVTADSDETIVQAARRMRDRHVGDLVVVDKAGRPVGMLTDRDIVVSAVAQSPDKLAVLIVGDVMSADVVTVREAQPIDDALKLMRSNGVRRLPVVSAGGQVDGLVALDDILEVMSTELGALVGLVAREQRHEREVRK